MGNVKTILSAAGVETYFIHSFEMKCAHEKEKWTIAITISIFGIVAWKMSVFIADL